MSAQRDDAYWVGLKAIKISGFVMVLFGFVSLALIDWRIAVATFFIMFGNILARA